MHFDAVVKINNLQKSFSSKPLFKNLNLNIYKGQINGIIGANGSGKTTLLKLICGLIFPDEGTIEIFGYDIKKSRMIVMQKIGVVLEGSRNLYWRLSGWQNLVYFDGLRGVYGQTLRAKGEALLKELELWNVKDVPVQNYSRGMQQKLAIICAVISESDLLLLDEPTLALDSSSQEIFEQWITKISQEKGKTVIITSHQHPMIERLCDHMITLTSGFILEEIKKNKKNHGILQVRNFYSIMVNEIRKEMLLVWSYRIQWLCEIIALMLFFFFLSRINHSSFSESKKLEFFLINYAIWFYAILIIGHMGGKLASEMRTGTFEQICLAIVPMAWILTARILASIIRATVLFLLLIIPLIFLFSIHICFQNVLLFFITFIYLAPGLIGLSFLLGGITLLVKDAGPIINIVNNTLLFLSGGFVSLEVFPHWIIPLSKHLLTTQAIKIFQTRMQDDNIFYSLSFFLDNEILNLGSVNK